MMTVNDMRAAARTIETDTSLMQVYLGLDWDVMTTEEGLAYMVDEYIKKDERFNTLYDYLRRAG